MIEGKEMKDDSIWMVKQASNIELNQKKSARDESPKPKQSLSLIKKEHIRRSL